MARSGTRDVVVVGGAVAVLLLFFRGSGWGTGGSGGSSHSGDGGGWLGLDEAARRSQLVIYVGARDAASRGVYFVAPTIEATRSAKPSTLDAAVETAKRHAAAGGEVRLHASGAARQGDYHAIEQRLVEAGVRFFEKPVR